MGVHILPSTLSVEFLFHTFCQSVDMSRPVNLCINSSTIFFLPPSLHTSISYLILSVPEAIETIGLLSLAPTSANSLLNTRVLLYGTICLGKFVLLSVWLSSNSSFVHILLLISCNCILPILHVF